MKKVKKLLEQAQCLEKSVQTTYDYSDLTVEQLRELLYGLENGTLTEERQNELMESVKVIKVRIDKKR